MIGMILGVHRNSPPGEFTVLKRVTGNEYPPVKVHALMREHKEQTHPDGGPAYTKIWWTDVTVPDE